MSDSNGVVFEDGRADQSYPKPPGWVGGGDQLSMNRISDPSRTHCRDYGESTAYSSETGEASE